VPSSTLIDLAPPQERAFLIAVGTGTDPGWSAESSLEELAALADTARRRRGRGRMAEPTIDPNWYLGKGKAEELLDAKSETGFTLLVADDELSPNQQKALESLLKVKVLDRSGLILDIFAQHAQTHEGRLQVELAQLEYQLPRLTRMWTHLSRTGGGIGTRGPARRSWRPTGGSSARRSRSSRSGWLASVGSVRRPLDPATAVLFPRSLSSVTRTPASRPCSMPSSVLRRP
jgi:hypothetical protein